MSTNSSLNLIFISVSIVHTIVHLSAFSSTYIPSSFSPSQSESEEPPFSIRIIPQPVMSYPPPTIKVAEAYDSLEPPESKKESPVPPPPTPITEEPPPPTLPVATAMAVTTEFGNPIEAVSKPVHSPSPHKEQTPEVCESLPSGSGYGVDSDSFFELFSSGGSESDGKPSAELPVPKYEPKPEEDPQAPPATVDPEPADVLQVQEEEIPAEMGDEQDPVGEEHIIKPSVTRSQTEPEQNPELVADQPTEEKPEELQTSPPEELPLGTDPVAEPDDAALQDPPQPPQLVPTADETVPELSSINTVTVRKRDKIRAKAIPVLLIKILVGPQIAEVAAWLMKEKAKGVDIAPQLEALTRGGGV